MSFIIPKQTPDIKTIAISIASVHTYMQCNGFDRKNWIFVKKKKA
jgi:hypothetical protein